MDTGTQSHRMDSTPKDMLRKVKKPLMEKRRRARINTCLNELKSLVLQAMNKNGSQLSKLEKADILEMTVQYLRGVQRSQYTSADPTAMVTSYRTGFTQCAQEVAQYLTSAPGINDDLRLRVMNHMASCVHTVNAQTATHPAATAISMSTLHSQQPQTVIQTAFIPGQSPAGLQQPVFVQIPTGVSPFQNNLGQNIILPPSPPASAEPIPVATAHYTCLTPPPQSRASPVSTGSSTSRSSSALSLCSETDCYNTHLESVYKVRDSTAVVHPMVSHGYYMTSHDSSVKREIPSPTATQCSPLSSSLARVSDEQMWRPW